MESEGKKWENQRERGMNLKKKTHTIIFAFLRTRSDPHTLLEGGTILELGCGCGTLGMGLVQATKTEGFTNVRNDACDMAHSAVTLTDAMCMSAPIRHSPYRGRLELLGSLHAIARRMCWRIYASMQKVMASRSL